MAMKEPLVIIRVVGGFFGVGILLWGFARFRLHLIRRAEFLWTTVIGLGISLVAVEPDVVNFVAGVLAMEGKQYGRLISLLLLSSLLLWTLVLGLRSRSDRAWFHFDLLVRALAQEAFAAKQGYEGIKEVTVIIPALDEAENLQQLLPRMPQEIAGLRCGTLVVDDGSTDGTASVARQSGCPVAEYPINRGGGAALRLGYDIAMTGGAEIVVTMDGDGQHLPEEIEHLVLPIVQGTHDFVIGSRILGSREKDSTIRLMGIYVFNFIINTLAGTKISDCSNGFRAFRVSSLSQVLLIQDQFHTAELLIDAARKGIRIGEAPVTVKRRHSGTTKKGRNLSYGWNFSKTVLRTWLRK